MTLRVKSRRPFSTPDQVPREEVFCTTADHLPADIDAELRERVAERDRPPAVVRATPERRGYGK